MAGDLSGAEQAQGVHWWLWAESREHHFREVVDGLPALAALLTPTGEVELVNQTALEYLGATLEELRGQRITESLHPDDLQTVLSAWRNATDTGQPYDIEARHRRADGVYRWFQICSFPLRDSEGSIAFWYVLHSDVDDRKRAEALLADEKRLLEMVARGQPLPEILQSLCLLVEGSEGGCYCSVVLVDGTGTHLEHGAAPSLPPSFIGSIIGRPVNVDSGPCAMAASLNQQVIAADLRSETRWTEWQWSAMAMAYGLMACWSTPIASNSGRVLGAFALYYHEPKVPTPVHLSLIERFTHIAAIAIERTQRDTALKRSEEFLAKAQQVSSTGGFYWRPATGEVIWSEQVYRIFELDPAAPVTLDLIRTRLHPDDIPAFEEMLERQLREGTDFVHDHRLLLPDGSVKHLHVVAHATREGEGGLLYIAAVQDVTERRLSEEALGKLRSELAHLSRVTTLGALTASIAHEINQPLSGILTNANTSLRMLAAEPPNVDGARETARRTIRDAHRASDVIARLRALFGNKGPTVEKVDLNEAIREVIALSASELQRGRVVLRLELDEQLPVVLGDRVQLQQVVLNLLLNGIDAMREVEDRPKELMIRTEGEEGNTVRVSVRDCGAGLDPGNRERLFDAFYTTKSNGMGIGLAVSRSIIESHHGRLWAASNEGPGATLSFSIPRELTEQVDGSSGRQAPQTTQQVGS